MIRILLFISAIALVLAFGYSFKEFNGQVYVIFRQYTFQSTLYGLLTITVIVYVVIRFIKYVFAILKKGGEHFGAKRRLNREHAFENAFWASINDDHQGVKAAFKKCDALPDWRDQQLALQAKASISEQDTSSALSLLGKMTEQGREQVTKLRREAGESIPQPKLSVTNKSFKNISSTALGDALFALLEAKQQEELIDLLKASYKKLTWSETQWVSFFDDVFAQNTGPYEQCFSKLPKPLQEKAKQSYLKAMAQSGQIQSVQSTLLKLIKKEQFEVLSQIIAIANGGDPKLSQALQEKLKKQPEQPQLLFCLAAMAKADRDYELAAKVCDKLDKSDWSKQKLKVAISCYEQTKQFEKAFLLLKQAAHNKGSVTT